MRIRMKDGVERKYGYSEEGRVRERENRNWKKVGKIIIGKK
jgi:hypothetical protein